MKVLSGWKEIAKYLGRGVRTAQRWERLGLPVHRPTGKGRSAITALAHELEAWLATTPRGVSSVAELQAELERLKAENERLRRQIAASTIGSARQQAASD